VAAFFFVFRWLASFIFVSLVALALQHIDNTDIFNSRDSQAIGLSGNPPILPFKPMS
jgi:hypothetical protein